MVLRDKIIIFEVMKKRSSISHSGKSQSQVKGTPDNSLKVQGSLMNEISNTHNDLQLPSIQNIKKSGIPMLQNLIEASPKTHMQKVSPHDLETRIINLQGNLRLMQKKYRQNLKQGFENKIKAYRLQAVLQRKALKQRLQDASKTIQIQNKLQKHHHAMIQHNQQRQFVQYLKHRNKQRSLKIREKTLIQRQNISLNIKERHHKIQVLNKELHDRILEDHELNSRKKQYFDNLRKFLVKKDVQQQKKQAVQQILQKSKVLQTIKEQLKQAYRRQDQIKDLNAKDRTFLTI